MQPWPPWAMKPSAVASSPESCVEVGPELGPLLGHPHHVGGGVLDPGDVPEFVEPLHRIDRHVDHRARRDVVDDDGNPDRIVDRLEMLIQAFLGRLVVIGGHHQHRVGARPLGMPREFDRLPRRVRPRTRDHGHAPPGLVDAPFDHLLVLVMGERRAFARGSDRDQAIGALPDLPFHQRAECASSSEPFLNGVTSAVNDPRKLVLAPMIRSWKVAICARRASPA